MNVMNNLDFFLPTWQKLKLGIPDVTRRSDDGLTSYLVIQQFVSWLKYGFEMLYGASTELRFPDMKQKVSQNALHETGKKKDF